MLTRRANCGFTMVEAMVALAVLALLIALAVPSVGDYIRTAQVRSTAEAVLNGLNKARATAMTRNRVVTFWLVSPNDTAALDDTCRLSSASASWVISLEDPSLKCSVAPSSTAAPRIVETHGAGAGAGQLTVAATSEDGSAATSISFNGFGQIDRSSGASQIGRIDVKHQLDKSARELSVRISSTGGVRLCDLNVEDGDPRACPKEEE